MMNDCKNPCFTRSRDLNVTPHRVKYVNQASATPVVGKVLGVCPECGNPLLGLEDRITCSRAKDAGCIFTITDKEFEGALYGSLSPFLVEILINTMSYQEFLHDLGSSPERKFGIEYESLMECSVYIELRVVKDDDGSWTIGIAYKQYFADDAGK